MPKTLINVEALSCQAGAQYLLHDINWEIKEGENWVVFGRNGCGKTTLLSIIAGYKAFSNGKLMVFGEQYTEENILDLRKKIGWISSSFFDKFYHSERVLDIVLSGLYGTLGTNFAISNNDIKKAKSLLREVGLERKIVSTYDMLSKGERQQVLIARAFMSNPEILILDEPGTGLDAMARAKLLETLRELAERSNKTMIFVTHYPEEILPPFDHCVLLRDGVIYKTGATEELFVSEIMSDFFEYPVEIKKEDELYTFKIESITAQNLLVEGGFDYE